jgi:hypothetical protein
MPTKKPRTVVDQSIRETSNLYEGGKRLPFHEAREAALDRVGLEPGSTTRHAVRCVASAELGARGLSVQRKKRRIKFLKDHHEDLFPEPPSEC